MRKGLRFFIKNGVTLTLAVLMIFSSVMTVIAATVSHGGSGASYADKAIDAVSDSADNAADADNSEEKEIADDSTAADTVVDSAPADEDDDDDTVSVSRNNKGDSDLAKTGTDYSDTNNNSLYFKGPGEANFTQRKINSAGYIDFTLTTSGYCEWYFYSWRHYKHKPNDAWPDGGMGDTTSYYAKKSSNDGGEGSENYYKWMPAGDYVVHFEETSDTQLKFQFYRKKYQVYGMVRSSSWDGTRYDMTYDSGHYYYDVPANGGNIEFRYQIEGTNVGSWENGYNLYGNNNRTSGTAYGSNEGNDDKSFKLATSGTDNYIYRICVQGGTSDTSVWVERFKKTEFWLAGYLNAGDVASGQDKFKFNATANADVFTLTKVFQTYQDGAQWAVIYDGRNAYHPGSSGASSNAQATTINLTPRTGNEWKASGSATTVFHFTWNASTKRLSWTTETAKDYYFVSADTGEDGSWGIDQEHGFTPLGDGTYAFEFTFAADSGYMFHIESFSGTLYQMSVGSVGDASWYFYDSYIGVDIQTYVAPDNPRNITWHGSAGTYALIFNPTTKILRIVPNTKYDITLTDSGTNGSSTISPAAGSSVAYQTQKVTLTTSPSAGYIAVVTVTNDSTSGAVACSRASNVYTFDMPASDVTVAVSYREKTYVNVSLYVNPGGSVDLVYDGDTTTVTEGNNTQIRVYEGASITLTATPDPGNSFAKWMKNLSKNYSTTASLTETIDGTTVYVANFNGGGSASWLNSGTAAGSRTAVNPISGFSAFDTSQTGGAQYGQFRFMYGTSDTGLGSALVPSRYKTDTSYNSYWADLTDALPDSGNFYFELCSYANKGNGVGNTNEEINGSASTQTIQDAEGNTLFVVELHNNNDVNGNRAKYMLLRSIDWDRVSAIGVVAQDYSKSTNGSNSNNGKVNYQFYYKAKGGEIEVEEYIPTVDYYAKDSTLRDGNVINWLKSGDTKCVDTVVSPVADSVTVTESAGKNYEAGMALKGNTITVTTTISDTGSFGVEDSDGNHSTVTARNKYYVKGFSFNGVTPQTFSWRNDGVYTCTYKIPSNSKEDVLEITPIYFIRDEYARNTCVFYLNGYNDTIKSAGWGNTLFVYPFYKYYKTTKEDATKTTYEGQAENFGKYPGQPVINEGGQLYTQIPLVDDGDDGKDNNNPIKGVTINNGYNDKVHKDYAGHVSTHMQTYDYDDFQKIYNEKATSATNGNLHSIYFSFKFYPTNTSKQHRLSDTTSNYTEEKAKDGTYNRYNDIIAPESNLSAADKQSVTAAEMTAFGTASNGWEDLTDALGNKVDLFGNRVTKSTDYPVKVISMGYEYNNAGTFASEWAVYVYNTSTSKYELKYDPNWGIDSSSGHNNVGYNSSIVPSALVMNSADSFGDYTAMDGDLGIDGFSGLYTVLKTACAGYPVEICYESDTPDKDNAAYRCDGRWTYTTDANYVQSSIKIEYYDNNGDKHNDTFNEGTHVGATTGCSAYFKNSAYYGETISDTELISNSERYSFAAEPAGAYEFVGWYMYDTSGHETTITTTDLQSSTLRSGNFEIVARFKYVASGTLTITNTLAPGQEGRGTTYLGVVLIKGETRSVLADVNSNTDPVRIDNYYIRSSSSYSIEVTLKTVPTGENQFNTYSCNKVDASSGTPVSSSVSSGNTYFNPAGGVATAVSSPITFTVSSLFTSGVQHVKSLDYTATLTPVHYKYNLTFTYPSRVYGTQSFTKTGELTSGQISDASVLTSADNNRTLRSAFIARIAPYESNFNKDINFVIPDLTVAKAAAYNAGTNTWTFTQTYTGTASDVVEGNPRTATFTVPYAQTNGVPDASPTPKTATTTFSITSNYDGLFYTSKTNFVTAPSVITDGGNSYPFQYWSIKTKSSDDRGASREIARCYFPEFNYRAIDNYQVEAIYGDEPSAAGYQTLYYSNVGATVAFLGNSRNQWNNSNKGDTGNYDSLPNSGDLIYNDFIFFFKPSGDGVEITEKGMILERLDMVEIDKSGNNAKTIAEYAEGYASSESTSLSAATTLADGAGTNASVGSFRQVKVDLSDYAVSNKNSMHYAYPLYKSTGGTDKTMYKYVYRVFSYMKAGDTTYVSQSPAYFYMYDIATK